MTRIVVLGGDTGVELVAELRRPSHCAVCQRTRASRERDAV
jgi:hypothetical protein